MVLRRAGGFLAPCFHSSPLRSLPQSTAAPASKSPPHLSLSETCLPGSSPARRSTQSAQNQSSSPRALLRQCTPHPDLLCVPANTARSCAPTNSQSPALLTCSSPYRGVAAILPSTHQTLDLPSSPPAIFLLPHDTPPQTHSRSRVARRYSDQTPAPCVPGPLDNVPTRSPHPIEPDPPLASRFPDGRSAPSTQMAWGKRCLLPPWPTARTRLRARLLSSRHSPPPIPRCVASHRDEPRALLLSKPLSLRPPPRAKPFAPQRFAHPSGWTAVARPLQIATPAIFSAVPVSM